MKPLKIKTDDSEAILKSDFSWLEGNFKYVWLALMGVSFFQNPPGGTLYKIALQFVTTQVHGYNISSLWFPVCSACPVGGNHRTGVREIYSAMHNIIALEKSSKRLTVNRERWTAQPMKQHVTQSEKIRIVSGTQGPTPFNHHGWNRPWPARWKQRRLFSQDPHTGPFISVKAIHRTPGARHCCRTAYRWWYG